MKHTLFILALFTATIQTFAQSPRIKLNQITKDSITGSVLISSPTDSGMVYSRDLFISYGADTFLILGGDTLAATSSIISSVLSDGVTITGDGTLGSELTVDTATVIATKQDLDLKQDQLNGTGFVKATGTTISYDNSTYLTSEVDGSVTNEGSLTVGAGGANDAVISSNTSGSSDVTISGSTNVTVTESGQTITIASSGGAIPVDTFVTIEGTETITGAKTFTSALTQSSGDVNFDSGTFFVDEDADNVGIGTTSPFALLHLSQPSANTTFRLGNSSAYDQFIYFNGNNDWSIGMDYSNSNAFVLSNFSTIGTNNRIVVKTTGDVGIGTDSPDALFHLSQPSANTTFRLGNNSAYDQFIYFNGNNDWSIGMDYSNSNAFVLSNASTIGTNDRVVVTTTGDVGIGTTPGQKLEVNGKVKISDLTGTGGNAVYENGGVLGVASDARFKNYIGDIDNGIQKVLNLKPKYFIDNRNSAFQQLGFYAQEVKSVINEASYPIGNTDYYGINDRAIIAVTVKAIQEQQAIIESQATEIEQLKSQIQLILNEIE